MISNESGSEKSRKRLNRSDSHLEPSAKRVSCAQKISDVEKIVVNLKEKHGSQYTTEKLNAWAHMVQMGKHDSLEATQSSLFGRAKGKRNSDSAASMPCLLPGKRINLRTECLDQLSKWHCLLEKGAISQTQYDDFQKKILGDIADL